MTGLGLASRMFQEGEVFVFFEVPLDTVSTTGRHMIKRSRAAIPIIMNEQVWRHLIKIRLPY
jgi:hypothetical protein